MTEFLHPPPEPLCGSSGRIPLVPGNPIAVLRPFRELIGRIECALGKAVFEDAAAPAIAAFAADAAVLGAKAGSAAARQLLSRMAFMSEAAAAEPPKPGENPLESFESAARRKAAAALFAAAAASEELFAFDAFAESSEMTVRWMPQDEALSAFVLRAARRGRAAWRSPQECCWGKHLERHIESPSRHSERSGSESLMRRHAALMRMMTPKASRALGSFAGELAAIALGLSPETDEGRALLASLQLSRARSLARAFPREACRAAASGEGRRFFGLLLAGLLRSGAFEPVDAAAAARPAAASQKKPRLWRAQDGFWLEWPEGGRVLGDEILRRYPPAAGLGRRAVFAPDAQASASLPLETVSAILLAAEVFAGQPGTLLDGLGDADCGNAAQMPHVPEGVRLRGDPALESAFLYAVKRDRADPRVLSALNTLGALGAEPGGKGCAGGMGELDGTEDWLNPDAPVLPIPVRLARSSASSLASDTFAAQSPRLVRKTADRRPEKVFCWGLTGIVPGPAGEAIARAVRRLADSGKSEQEVSAEPRGVFLSEKCFAPGEFEVLAGSFEDMHGLVLRPQARFTPWIWTRVTDLGELEQGLILSPGIADPEFADGSGKRTAAPRPKGRTMAWLGGEAEER